MAYCNKYHFLTAEWYVSGGILYYLLCFAFGFLDAFQGRTFKGNYTSRMINFIAADKDRRLNNVFSKLGIGISDICHRQKRV